ncbi:MAG: GNAT family N-acetyltransferase [Huintestinicola sp.]
MDKYKIVNINDRRDIIPKLSEWFHEKWGFPAQAYLDSMNECIRQSSPVPQWYAVLDKDMIIAGLGVIENDFHDRKDLSPNVCSVYVDEKYRSCGIAGEMLGYVCRDMTERGIPTLYLVTDHTSFYERYGWRFLCMAQGDGEPHMTRLYIHEQE